jgi:2-(3-amino-3-carboxypropyl)histidine synthase
METLFIEASSGLDIVPPKKSINQLPKSIGLFTTVQHARKIGDVKKALEAAGRKVHLLKGAHSRYDGQALGCDLFSLKPSREIEAFLYIGTGEFHPKELLMLQKKPVYIYNPGSKRFYQLGKKDIEQIQRRRKGARLRFLSSTKIGVLITTKPGQQGLAAALRLREIYPGKDFFFLIADTFDFSSLENFPFIECYVNTACPRIGYDEQENLGKPIINIADIRTRFSPTP